MTERELRRLSKVDLLELLTQVTREKEALQRQVAELQARLEQRQLNLDQAGTLAEASLRLSGVFADIDAAGQEYLYNIQHLSQVRTAACERLERESRAQADAILSDARAQADRILSLAQQQAETLEAGAQARAEKILARAQTQTDAYWAEVSAKLRRFYDEHPGLRSALEEK